jgi:putative CocE/NonD family hydrolase
LGEAVRWLDYVIKGVDTKIAGESPIRLFVMGKNEWRFEDAWPVSRTQFTQYYFHITDGGRMGVLDTTAPGDETPTRYTYDPEDPVPSLGGNHSADARRNLDHFVRNGPVDQRPNENRDDLLVFSTSELEEDVEVIGPIEVVLYASSSAVDTDFVVRLINVYPDGIAFNLTEGIIRARFRKSLYEPPELMTPGEVYTFTITLYPTANVFLKGHRIRVHITSSGFPLWDRNPNTGHEQGMDAEIQVANQTVYHDEKYPSHIVLPIVER